MTRSPLDEYREQTYDKTVQKLLQEQESRQTPVQKLLAKTDIQPTQK